MMAQQHPRSSCQKQDSRALTLRLDEGASGLAIPASDGRGRSWVRRPVVDKGSYSVYNKALTLGTVEGNMTVRSALIQATGSMDKDDNVARQLDLITEAANQGSQITCLQELFFGPYFCQVQDAKWYGLAEPIPGPTTTAMQEAAKRYSMVLVVPLYEEEGPGIY